MSISQRASKIDIHIPVKVAQKYKTVECTLLGCHRFWTTAYLISADTSTCRKSPKLVSHTVSFPFNNMGVCVPPSYSPRHTGGGTKPIAILMSPQCCSLREQPLGREAISSAQRTGATGKDPTVGKPCGEERVCVTVQMENRLLLNTCPCTGVHD